MRATNELPKTELENFIFNELVKAGNNGEFIKFCTTIGDDKRFIRYKYWRPVALNDVLNDLLIESFEYDDDCGNKYRYHLKDQVLIKNPHTGEVLTFYVINSNRLVSTEVLKICNALNTKGIFIKGKIYTI